MGRFDIALEPKEAGNLPGLIIELKAAKSAQEDLQELAAKALAQIEEKRYDTEMKMKGVATIYKYGIAFFKKQQKLLLIDKLNGVRWITSGAFSLYVISVFKNLPFN